MVKKQSGESRHKGGLRVLPSDAPPRPVPPAEREAELRELIRQLTEPARRAPQNQGGDNLPPAA